MQPQYLNQPQQFGPPQMQQFPPQFQNQMQMMSQQQQQPNPQQAQRGCLYVGDLEEEISEAQLYTIFSRFGQIDFIKILRDIKNKKSRGFAYVQFFNQKSAEQAMLATNHTQIINNRIRVAWKKTKADFDPNANVYIKNIDKNLIEKDLEVQFAKYGQIISLKISRDQQGNSLGYGYAQFANSAAAEKCIEENKETVLKFQNRNDRQQTRNNLYVKNIPKTSEEEASIWIKENFEKYGTILSQIVKMDEKEKKPFAFVCFQSNIDAEKALKEIVNEHKESNIYVNWAEKKQDRKNQLSKAFSVSQNDTNIFTKNLKEEVTEAELKEAFSTFGKITSCKTKEEAREALAKANESPQIQKLYEKGKPFLNFLIQKAEYQQYLKSKKRQQKSSEQTNQYEGFPQQGVFNPIAQFQKNLGGPQNQNQMMQFNNLVMALSFASMLNQYSQQQQQQQAQQQQMMRMGPMPGPHMQQFLPFMQQQNPMNFQNLNSLPKQQQMGGVQQQQQQQQYPPNKQPVSMNQMGGGPQQNQMQSNMQMRPQQGQMMNPNIQKQQARRPPQQQQKQFQKAPNQYSGPQKQMNQMGQQPRNMQQQQIQQQPMQMNQFQQPQQQVGGPQMINGIPSNIQQQNQMGGQIQQQLGQNPVSSQQQAQTPFTAQNLKSRIDEFQVLDKERQRNLLGEMLYPLVKKFITDSNLAPKVTGMLIDFDVFEVTDILEFIEDESELQNRINEAISLIDQTSTQQNV